MANPAPSHPPGVDPAKRLDTEEENFVARYLRTAPAEELAVLDGLAELDRKYGSKPTPR